MPSSQSILYTRPKVTMAEIEGSSAEAFEPENLDTAPVQPLVPLPPRTQRAAHTTMQCVTRWLTHNFTLSPVPPTPQTNIEMSNLHRLDSEVREPRIIPTDQGRQQQSGQASESQTQQVAQIRQSADDDLRARFRALPFWVVVSACSTAAVALGLVIGVPLWLLDKRS